MSGPKTWRDRVEGARAEGLLAKEFFVVLTEPAGDKDKVREVLPTHLDYQRGLEADSKLLAAGPLSDETGTEWTGKGMIILRAENLAEAKALADADPMHSSGARRYTLVPWMMNEGGFNLRVSLSEKRVEFS